MAKLYIAGLGPGGAEKITMETLQAIKEAGKVILRTEIHPAAAGLTTMGITYTSCDHYYREGKSFEEIYGRIADFVIEEALNAETVCYCVPGHPLVAEETVALLLQKAGEGPDIHVLPAVSFLDSAFIMLGLDPVEENLTILDAAGLSSGGSGGLLPLPKTSCLFAQVYDPFIAGELKLALLEEAPPDAELLILHHAGVEGEEELILCPLAEMDHFRKFDHLTSVFLPLTASDGKSNRIASAAAFSEYPLDPLVDVFRRLLGPGGCPWDQKQTHETLKRYLLEEANEALEAIDEGDADHLKEELGDVLMQILFHCMLADQRGDFDLNGVIAGITEKMIRRHPHVFGNEKADSPEEVAVLWQKIKEEEKQSNMALKK